MLGYIVASLVTEFAKGSDVCYYILCWRWPFLIEVALITPLSLILTIIPKNIISVKVIHGNHDKKKQKLKMQLQLQTQINLRSISLNSFSEKKQKNRSNSLPSDIAPISQSKAPISIQNRTYSSPTPFMLSTQNMPLLYATANADYQTMKSGKSIYSSVGTSCHQENMSPVPKINDNNNDSSSNNNHNNNDTNDNNNNDNNNNNIRM